jgi:hypothetical protein
MVRRKKNQRERAPNGHNHGCEVAGTNCWLPKKDLEMTNLEERGEGALSAGSDEQADPGEWLNKG